MSDEARSAAREFRARLDQALAAGRRDFAVARVELDRFERIRDWHGDAVGDAIDVTLTARLVEVSGDPDLITRESDSLRLVVLTADDSDHEALALLAWRLMERMSEPITGITDDSIAVGTTVGIVHPDSLSEPDSTNLMNAATVASHRASIHGSRRIAVFEDLSGLFGHVSELDRSLLSALDDGQVRPWFQPQVRLSDGAVVGAEALARWDHPTLGVVAPSAFVPEAEWSGIIQRVDLAILEQAALTASTWPGDLQVAVNISAANLDNPHLTQRVLAALNEGALTPDRVVIEVTETSLAQDRRAAMSTLAEFRAWGFTASLDDFGAGHAFFDALRDGLFGEVKIDRSILSPHRGESSAFLAAVVDLAKSVGARTVAEGIETAAELQRALDTGCDLGQGYLFARPMPPEVFLEFLRAGDVPAHVDVQGLLDSVQQQGAAWDYSRPRSASE